MKQVPAFLTSAAKSFVRYTFTGAVALLLAMLYRHFLHGDWDVCLLIFLISREVDRELFK